VNQKEKQAVLEAMGYEFSGANLNWFKPPGAKTWHLQFHGANTPIEQLYEEVINGTDKTPS
jgi:hypothetical protein